MFQGLRHAKIKTPQPADADKAAFEAELKKARDEAAALRKQIEATRLTVPIMRELTGAPVQLATLTR